MPRGPPRTAAPEVGRGLEGVADRRWRMRRVVRVVICSSDPPRWGCEVTVTHLVTVRGRLTANCEVVSSLLSGRQGITGSTSSPRTKEHSMSQGPIGQHRLAIDVRDDVRGDLADVLHDMHLWVPGADYFGPVWVEGVGWVVPQGWEAPHGWASPPGWHQPAYWDHDNYREWCNNHYSSDHDWRGWENCEHYQNHDNWHGWVPDADYFGPVWVEGVGWVVPQGWEAPHGWASPPGWHQPAYWDHDDYREWCNNHYSSDHDWRGWESSYHWGEHNQWHGWNDHDHRAWNDHDGDDRGWNDHDRSAWNDHDGDHRAWNDHDGDDRARNDHDHRAWNDHEDDDRARDDHDHRAWNSSEDR